MRITKTTIVARTCTTNILSSIFVSARKEGGIKLDSNGHSNADDDDKVDPFSGFTADIRVLRLSGFVDPRDSR